MNKLNWKEIQDLIDEPVYDKKSNMWRVIDSYKYENNKYFISFTDLDYWENFNDVKLYKEKIIKEGLLSKQEKEVLKDMVNNIKKFLDMPEMIEIIDYDIYTLVRFYNKNIILSDMITNLKFKNIKENKIYTLKELGLD